MLAHRMSSVSLVGFLLVTAVALTGCIGAPAEGSGEGSQAASSSAPRPSESPESTEPDGAGQTVGEACAMLQEGAESVRTGLTENLSTFQSDPAAASTALHELAASFSTDVDEVVNPQISSAATTAEEALLVLDDRLAEFAENTSDPDIEGLTESATEVQSAFAALREACA